jgi:glycerol kinase
MQFQADISGIPVVRPGVLETTAIGAAYHAGLATGYWEDQDEIEALWNMDSTFEPEMDKQKRDALYQGWKMAVDRSLDWAEDLREAGIDVEAD